MDTSANSGHHAPAAHVTSPKAPTQPGLSRRHLLQASALAAGGVFATRLMSASVAEATTASSVQRLSDGGWDDFLGALDLTWQSVPGTFYEGPFLGNGGMGAAVYQKAGNRLCFNLGDSRVRDHQGVGGPLWGDARLPIGYFTLDTVGDVTDVDLRLSLHNAQLSGFVTTTKGVIRLQALIHGTRDLLHVSTVPVSGSENPTWKFTAATAITPRNANHPGDRPTAYHDNPAPTVTTTSTGGQCVQDLYVGGQTITQWSTRTGADGVSTELWCTVAHSATDHSASTVAAAAMSHAAGATTADLVAEHRQWWGAFYAKSFISVPDTRLMSFYWTQLYKVASATRDDRPVMTTSGPWLEATWWPAAWWNLNVQLEYWLINGSGHPELDAISTAFREHQDNLTQDTPAAYRSDSIAIGRTGQNDMVCDTPITPGQANAESGNFIWAMQNAWLAYRHSMDDTVLRDLVYPLLKKAVAYYLHFVTKDSSGTYHLPETYSPEYGDTKDCNYDLALLSWGCTTLLAATERLGVSDSSASTWQDLLDNLVTPPQDAANGLWIGADLKLTSSHRHYSHLLWFYPLFEMDPLSSAGRDLLTRTMTHWTSMTSAWTGFSYSGSGSMYAVLGDGDSAITQLHSLFDKFIEPNTMYQEGGGAVIETPLSAAKTLQDMLVQSWGDTIRVFPAIPSAWDDVAIADFATEGAFTVCARRSAGKTTFVSVRSNAGEPCRVIPGDLTTVQISRTDGTTFTGWSRAADGALELTLAKGDEVVISAEGSTPSLEIAPVSTPTEVTWGTPPGGGTTTADLSSMFNIAAASPADSASSGNFDGQGYSYPLEELPPPGIMASGDVLWDFPDSRAAKNALSPNGQVITAPSAATTVHLLAAAVNVSATSTQTVTLTYTDGSHTDATVTVPDWARSVPSGVRVAAMSTYRHGTGTQTALPCRIYHLSTGVDTTKTLQSVTLESNGKVRIFAISFE